MQVVSLGRNSQAMKFKSLYLVPQARSFRLKRHFFRYLTVFQRLMVLVMPLPSPRKRGKKAFKVIRGLLNLFNLQTCTFLKLNLKPLMPLAHMCVPANTFLATPPDL